MRRMPLLALTSIVLGCGSPAPEPVLGGTASGTYDDVEFSAENGFWAALGSNSVIMLGDGGLYCGAESADEPPSGYTAAIFPDTLEVGTQGSISVQILKNVGSYESYGTNSGTLTLTEVTDETVAGEVSFSTTDDEGRSFSFSGTFEVVRCPAS